MRASGRRPLRLPRQASGQSEPAAEHGAVTIRAYAKINLTLEVLGRRSDGYHEMRSVVQTIALHDSLRLDRAERWEVAMSGVPAAIEDNLITRAGQALEQMTGRSLPTRVQCDKRIPVTAGLGGGSSDAAATLVGLRRLWNLPLRRRDLATAGWAVGSDVPYLVQGGSALLEGRGEVVTTLPPLPARWVVLALPERDPTAKTATMYARLRPEHFTRGEHTASYIKAVWTEAADPAHGRWNVFELVVENVFPGIGALQAALSERSECAFRLSGAGPALFALLPDLGSARRCLSALKAERARLLLSRTTGAGPRAHAVSASQRAREAVAR